MYVKYYIQFLAILILFSGTGFLLIRGAFGRWLSTISFQTVFACLLSGTIFAATLTAIIYTRGQTILIAFIPLAILFILNARKKYDNTNAPKKNINQRSAAVTLMFTMILVTTPVFLSFYFSIVKGEPIVPYNVPHYDYVIYSNAAYFSKTTGQENTFHVNNTYDSSYHGPKAYHYFDSWTNVSISTLFGGIYFINLYLLTFPLLTCIALLGLLALGEQYKLSLKINIPLSLALLLFSGIAFSIYLEVPFLRNIDSFTFTILSGLPKLLTNYPFFIAAILLIEKNRLWQAILVLLCLPITSITAAPAIFGGLIVFALVNLRTNWFTFTEIKNVSIVTITTAGLIVCFYSILDKSEINMEGSQLFDAIRTIANQFELRKIKTKINIAGGTVVQLMLLYLPLVLSLLFLKDHMVTFFRQRKHKIILAVAASIFFAGLLSWVIFHDMRNSVQLFNNPVISTMNCFCFVIIFYVVVQLKHHTYKLSGRHIIPALLFVLIIGINSIEKINNLIYIQTKSQYSQQYLGDIKTWLNTQPDIHNVRGGSIKKIEGYKSFALYIAYYALGDYLSFLTNGVVPISLDNFDIPFSEDPIQRTQETNAIEQSLFYRYVQKQKKQQAFISIAQSQVDFVRQYNLRFVIIAAEETISEEMRLLVTEEFGDSVSRERFYVLK